MFDIRVNDHINVVVGCGLGGTSLINANVSLRAESRVFEDPRWPEEIRRDAATALADAYRHAEAMLRPTPYPEDAPRLPKLEAQAESAAAMKQRFYRPPINVTFTDGVNHVGVQQHRCTLCGDCVSGCNYGAKNTTLMNYLPDAWNHGAEIFSEVNVRHVARDGGRWRIHYQPVQSGREVFGAPPLTVSADVVVLAAGTLGSTEILLRSRERGLPLSHMLGRRFSGNGDVLGFGYNCARPINGVGFGHRQPENMEPVGPCITGIIDVREQPDLEHGLVIEEGVVPGATGSILPGWFAAAARVAGEATAPGPAAERAARELASLAGGPYVGAVRNTQTYLIMGHDDTEGRMYLEKDRLRIAWPRVGEADALSDEAPVQ